jgi:ABC transporter substrate binding protein
MIVFCEPGGNGGNDVDTIVNCFSVLPMPHWPQSACLPSCPANRSICRTAVYDPYARRCGRGENQYDRLPALAAYLVRRRVAVIVTIGIDPALAAKAATPNIPIVFATGGDPIASGLVASLNRLGVNVTGIPTQRPR